MSMNILSAVSKNTRVNFFKVLIPFFLLSALVFIMKIPMLKSNEILQLAVSIDLLLVVPFIYYLLIRKSKIPKTTVIPLMILGLILGMHFLPPESQTYLTLFKTWVLPFVEISVLTYVLIRVNSAIKKLKHSTAKTPDFYTALKHTSAEILPQNLVLPFATEIAVFYYAFLNWKTTILQPNEFSHHKNSGAPALFIVFILIIGVETFALHYLLIRWSEKAAWILTILSIYTAIQVIGFAKSLSKRPISINESSLTLKYGILNEVQINFDQIDSIELSSNELESHKLTKTLSPLGDLESHNVIMRLKTVHKLNGLYGFTKEFKVLAFHVDDVKGFMEGITNKI